MFFSLSIHKYWALNLQVIHLRFTKLGISQSREDEKRREEGEGEEEENQTFMLAADGTKRGKEKVKVISPTPFIFLSLLLGPYTEKG
jgi:hypothetical protein